MWKEYRTSILARGWAGTRVQDLKSLKESQVGCSLVTEGEDYLR